MARRGKGRRPDRIVDLTEDFIANMPTVDTSNSDVFYDRTEPRFAVLKTKSGNVTYQCRIDIAERRALKRRSGTPYVPLGTFESFAAAKARFFEVKKMVAEAMEKTTQTTLRGHDPATILREPKPTESDPKYEPLMTVLMDAYAEATNGKGHSRHGAGRDFVDQDMMQIMDRVGVDFALGQAIKKIVESRRLTDRQARNELLGAIVYLAGAIHWKDTQAERELNQGTDDGDAA